MADLKSVVILIFLVSFLSNFCACDDLEADKTPFLVFTVASENTDGYSRYMRSAEHFGVKVITLGLDKPWVDDGLHKINLLKEALKPYENDNEMIILFTNSYNVVFLTYTQIIIDEFKFLGAKVLFSADVTCPDVKLEKKFPVPENSTAKYLNSGMFMGYAANIYKMLNYASPPEGGFNDQMFYTMVYLDEKFRVENGIALDHYSELFHNLNGTFDEVGLFSLAGGVVVLKNTKYDTFPMLVQGNGESKIVLNIYGNYLAGNFIGSECRTGSEQLIPQKKRENFVVYLAIFIEYPVPFIKEFFDKILALSYPKNRMHIYIHNEVPYHSKDIDEFADKADREEYITLKITDMQGVNEAHARDFAITHCQSVNCDYLFSLDAVSHIGNPDTIQELIMFNKKVIAPMLTRRDSPYANFWGAIGDNGYYVRSFDYLGIIEREVEGLWNVPFISVAYLVHSSVLDKISYTADGWDPDMLFCRHMRDQEIFMYISNFNFYGVLVNNEMFDVTKKNPDFYEFFTNRYEWHGRYVHSDYIKTIQDGFKPEEPCQDVFAYPLVSDKFCEHLIEIMENYGQWSKEPVEETEYEVIPTRDILLRNVGLDEIWMEFLSAYVRPLTQKAYPGRDDKTMRSIMNFVIRYRPDEKHRLRLYHDATTFSVIIDLTQFGIDYKGGGNRFVRYNCEINDNKKGWMLVIPGRVTHPFEDLQVTNGTKYLAVSYMDP